MTFLILNQDFQFFTDDFKLSTEPNKIRGVMEVRARQYRSSFGTKVPFTSYSVNRCFFRGLESQGGVMTTLQAMCLGAMLAWTPSFVVLAWLLREAPLDELQHDPS